MCGILKKIKCSLHQNHCLCLLRVLEERFQLINYQIYISSFLLQPKKRTFTGPNTGFEFERQYEFIEKNLKDVLIFDRPRK